jgi:hypothetical protein
LYPRWFSEKGPDKEHNNTKPTKATISRSIDGKENVEMVRTRSKDGVRKKTKISAGGKTRRRKRKTYTIMARICRKTGM